MSAWNIRLHRSHPCPTTSSSLMAVSLIFLRRRCMTTMALQGAVSSSSSPSSSWVYYHHDPHYSAAMQDVNNKRGGDDNAALEHYYDSTVPPIQHYRMEDWIAARRKDGRTQQLSNETTQNTKAVAVDNDDAVLAHQDEGQESQRNTRKGNK